MSPARRPLAATLALTTGLSFGLAVAPATSAAAAPATAAVAPAAQALALPVTGTVTDAQGQAGTFTGTFTPQRFSVVDGVLSITGQLTGDAVVGETTTAVNQTVTTAVDVAANDACTILTLDLGPLNLNLLGLVVDLSAIELDITAVPGPGNLLGNLLCAVAGLLDRNAALQSIAALLNRLLAALG